MRPWIALTSLMLVLAGCATHPGAVDRSTKEAQAQAHAQAAMNVETHRLSDLGFAAGAHAVGHDSLVGVPIDLYRVSQDPEQTVFNDPQHQKNAWQFQVLQISPADDCDPTTTLSLSLIFADADLKQTFPLNAQWPLDCRHRTQMPGVFHTGRRMAAWVMFPKPRLDTSTTPPQIHFLTQDEVSDATGALPLARATLTVNEPMSITLRLRSRTAGGGLSPWVRQTIVVRPASLFTDASCEAIKGATTTVPEAKAALLQQSCGTPSVLPEGLRTSP